MCSDSEIAYLAWLASCKVPAEILKKLLICFQTGESIYKAVKSDDQRILEFVPVSDLNALRNSADPDFICRMDQLVLQHSIHAMTMYDPSFPSILQEITDPVSILFYQGSPECLSRRAISMVGSRRASYSGLKAAHQIAQDLSREGIAIVSGFAYGIDTSSHQGCLEGGSPTIAVMGCGLDQNYPAGNEALRKQVIDSGGILLSEYAPGEKPLPGHFPYRNRIIAALGEAVILVEAKIRSGSLRTVDHALEQGKEVFVYPGDPTSPFFEGNHQLLRDGGHYFSKALDILEDMNWLDKNQSEVQNSGCSISTDGMSPEEEKILRLLIPGELSFDQLAAQSAVSPSDLLSILTILQIRGAVEPLPGKKYQIKQ